MRKRHPNKALTAAKVRALNKAGRYADGNGLYLIVDPSGAKRWVLRTVVRHRRRDIGLGGLRLVSLAEAREEAERMRRLARKGEDPVAERRQNKRNVPTFAEAASLTHEKHKDAWRNGKHVAQWLSTLNAYAFPGLGKKRVDEITTPEILAVLSPIWLTKPETARRVRQRIHAVMDWAKAAGHRSGENPVDGVTKGLPKQGSKKGHFEALPYKDVPDFLRRLRASANGATTRLALEFLILTAARTSEVLNAKWSEIDAKSKTWTLPADRMKSKREHRVPLGPRAMAILAQARSQANGGDLIFPGQTGNRPLSSMTLGMVLRRMHEKATVHGFRSSFRDWSAECTSFSREVCEMALAHAIADKTEAAYRRGDLFERRRSLMAEWDSFISNA